MPLLPRRNAPGYAFAPMPRIFTHKQPDADALAAAYLAERFLFTGQSVEIVFVGRGQNIPAMPGVDCVVDVGNAYDPARLLFDHKPPAFADRNQSCATRLLWEYLCAQSKPVAHWADFVQTVQEGDRNPPGRPSPLLSQSRADGFHAAVSRLRRAVSDDASVYAAVRNYLDENAPSFFPPLAITAE